MSHAIGLCPTLRNALLGDADGAPSYCNCRRGREGRTVVDLQTRELSFVTLKPRGLIQKRR